MAKRPLSESDLNESQPAQREGAVVVAEETTPAPVTLGSLPVEGEGPQCRVLGRASASADK